MHGIHSDTAKPTNHREACQGCPMSIIYRSSQSTHGNAISVASPEKRSSERTKRNTASSTAWSSVYTTLLESPQMKSWTFKHAPFWQNDTKEGNITIPAMSYFQPRRMDNKIANELQWHTHTYTHSWYCNLSVECADGHGSIVFSSQTILLGDLIF